MHICYLSVDPNYYLENQGDGSFRNISLANGTQGVQVAGAYGHTIGTVFGDVDNDGDFDQVQANLAHPFFDLVVGPALSVDEALPLFDF